MLCILGTISLSIAFAILCELKGKPLWTLLAAMFVVVTIGTSIAASGISFNNLVRDAEAMNPIQTESIGAGGIPFHKF